MSSLGSVEETIDTINKTLRQQLFQKGVKGLKSLARTFKIADISGNGELDRDEFEEALNYAGLFLKKTEISMLFRYYDTNNGGTICYNEFVAGLAAPLSPRRVAIVMKIFKVSG